MARGGGGWGINKAARGKWVWGCSYKKTTLIVCSINIVVALYVLRSLYASLYIYSDRDTHPTVFEESPVANSMFNACLIKGNPFVDKIGSAVEYTPDQIRKMEESVRIRKSAEPVELIRLVKKLKKELSTELSVVELSEPLKLKITNEIIDKLKTLPPNANVTEQRDFAERWCNKKLEEAKQLIRERGTSNSTILIQEAVMLVKALESDRTLLLEDIGLWIPSEVVNKEHDDKPEGEVDELDEVLPGRPLPPECHAELHTDYDGAAVRWGLNHHKESAADCCQACLVQAKRAKPNEKKCNVWVYCPAEMGCHSPDIYEHRLGECWLKYAETPKLNFKDKYPESYRNAHPSAPIIVPWASGIVGAA